MAKQTDSPLARAVANEREFICEAIRFLLTPYAPSGKGLAPPAIPPEGMVQTLAALRALSCMVRSAANVEAPVLRAFDARYGYLLKYNMPVSKGPQLAAVATQPSVKQDGPSAPPRKAGAEGRPAGRTVDRIHPRGRSPCAPRKTRGGQKTRRPRSPRRPPPASSAESSAEKKVRDERVAAWLAGEDRQGSLRAKCANCYVGLGTHVPPARRSSVPGSGESMLSSMLRSQLRAQGRAP